MGKQFKQNNSGPATKLTQDCRDLKPHLPETSPRNARVQCVSGATVDTLAQEVPDPDDSWGPYTELDCVVTLEIPVPRFKVRDLLGLQTNNVVHTYWPQSKQIPLRVNGEAIAVAKFEPVNDRMCVRMAEVL